MKELGLALFLIGLVSLALPFISPGTQHALLTWVDNWGTTMGWIIRGGITLLGLVLWFGFKNRE